MLDMEFDIREIIARNSESDIIISSERHAETGVANTGCFIMKNSAWSRDFLHEWWTTYDRSEAHDQIFFDKLYKSKLPDIATHVAILPTDEINSTPPPMLWQEDHNQVLHMMQEPDQLRKHIFQSGLEEVCQAYTEERPLTPQFGLPRKVLAKMAEDFYVDEIRDVFPTLNSTEVDIATFYHFASICFEDFSRLVELGIDVTVDIAGFNGLINGKLKEIVTQTDFDMQSVVGLYNLAIFYAQLLFSVLMDTSYKLEMLHRIETYLNTMTPLLHESARHIAFNMQVRHYTMEGNYLHSLHQCSKAESAYQLGLNIFQDMETYADEVIKLWPVCFSFYTGYN